MATRNSFRALWVSLTIFFILLVSFTTSGQTKDPKTPDTGSWKTVDSLMKLQLPKSALPIVERLYLDAQRGAKHSGMVKAVIYRMAIAGAIEEDHTQQSVDILKKEIARSSYTPVTALLQSMLAEIYWSYYSNNYWLISQRSVTSAYEEKDFKLWDLQRLASEIIILYNGSLKGKEVLQEISLKQYDLILERGKDSKQYRPTLYDFLAHRALEFFTSGLSGLSRPAEQFVLDREEYFAENVQFIAIPIHTHDTMSLLFHTMRIYQDLTRFHLADKDPMALLEVNIARLIYVRQQSIKTIDAYSLFLAQIDKLSAQFINHPSYPWIRYQAASLHYSRHTSEPRKRDISGKLSGVLAYEICQEAIERFPKGDGAGDCQRIIAQLTEKFLSVESQTAIPAGSSLLYLTSYKNIPTVYYRIVKTNYLTFTDMSDKDRDQFITWITKQKPLHTWHLETKDPGDFTGHSFEYGTPLLDHGFYVLIASPSPGFGTDDNTLTILSFQVSNIAFLTRNDMQGNILLLVTDRSSGVPLTNIRVTAHTRVYDYSLRKWISKIQGNYLSNDAGMVKITPASEKQGAALSFTLAGTKGDTLQSITSTYLRHQVPQPERESFHTYLFLDRKIYRPGQIVYFKGIVVRSQGKLKSVAVGLPTEVKLLDVNHKVVSELRMVTNEFGSFQGSFILPSTGLTGQMVLSTEHGNEEFRMEEYKRPKFSVSMMPYDGVSKPGEVVTLQGKANAYAGYALTGSKVKYRITRQVQYPYFSSYRFFPREPAADTEIQQGEITIGDDGFFRIEFTAVPDPNTTREKQPVFYYKVFADVTDLNGETHSATSSVAIGYTTILLADQIPGEVDRSKGITFPVSATNLNNQPMEVSGSWTLYRIESPSKPVHERLWKAPDTWVMEEAAFRKLFPYDQYFLTEEADKPPVKVADGRFHTAKGATIRVSALEKAQSGRYMIVFEADDPSGMKVTRESRFLLFSTDEKRVPEPGFFSVRLLKQVAEPGDEVVILVGSSENTHMYYSIELDGRVQQEQWISLKNRQHQIRIKIEESHRGGLAVHFAGVCQNRPFTKTSRINIPFTNKKLDVRFATFRDKLQPGESEEYLVTIRGSQGEKVLAEMAAGMYDASLDAFYPNNWNLNAMIYNSVRLGWSPLSQRAFGSSQGNNYGGFRELRFKHRQLLYDQLNWFSYNPRYGSTHRLHLVYDDMAITEEREEEIIYGVPDRKMAQFESDQMVVAKSNNGVMYKWQIADSISVGGGAAAGAPEPSPPVKPRTNFNETAFFFPQLKTDEEGNIVFRYTVPESLTAWKLMLLAHTSDLKTGIAEKQLVTQKTLMVIPNAPRFFRAQDKISFTTKVTNLSDTSQVCIVKLKLFNGLTGEDLDAACLNLKPQQQITVKPGQSGLVSWELTIPEQAGAITYNVSAVSGLFSDGEEMTIPVLTNRMLVTESMPLPVTGKVSKQFSMEKLVGSGGSTTLKHHKLTLEFTSNPAWYAIQALPYLMEFPYECSEQLFSRFYANAMATHIANSSPKISMVFDSWRNLTPDALRSNLEKNQELKALLLEETPWVMQAASETDRKQRVALLFDLNRMADEMEGVTQKLKEQQTSNGGWSWFKGGPDNWYITQHIVVGISRLTQTGVIDLKTKPVLAEMTANAIYYLDKRFEEYYNDLRKFHSQKPLELQKDHLSQLTIQYLYARSGFLRDYPLEKSTREPFEWLIKQGVNYWTGQDLMMQGYLAVALNRLDERPKALLIMKSIKERSLFSEEMGRYWRANPGYFWYEAPIERQALLIEAFAEVSADMAAVEEMKGWLLKQKQTTDWKTTKATAEACYALLLRGTNLLASNDPATITVGGNPVNPLQDGATAPEAGTGYFKVSWAGNQITPAMGNVTVTSTNEGVSWGALYWQYFEQLDKITTHATPLQLTKKLFVEELTSSGVVIKPVTDGSTIKVGDKVVVRIELRVDRDMEYVHMKDMRASAFEPVTTLSGYKWQQGLGYYESPRDAAVNFFFDYLRKGTYLFEYRLFATHEGDFSNGVTTIQCMYAPEFTSHSEGIRILITN